MPPHSATPEYHSGTIKLALVFIERDNELPAHVAASVERILGIDTTGNTSGQQGEKIQHRRHSQPPSPTHTGSNVGHLLATAPARVNGEVVSTRS
jgi:hypothetical protein